jgi:hypothetical protein
MSSRAVTLCAAVLMIAASARAADEKPALKPGGDLPGPFRPYVALNGKYEGKFHCLVCEHGLNPAVLIFARDPNMTDPMAPVPKLLKGLDEYVAANPKTRLAAFAVFSFPDVNNVVTEDDARETRAAALRGQKAALQQVVLAIDSPARLLQSNYDIDPKAEVIVVLYDKLKIQNVYTFTPTDKPLNDAGVNAVLKEVREKLAPKK